MKVHLKDIAEKVGVSKMTVSRALREDPLVAEATRKKVLAVAKELGFVPNPKLARLMSEMARSRKSTDVLGELVYITTESTEFGWKEYAHERGCFDGAKVEARAYGYNLTPFWALSRRFANNQLSEFLWARGVDGFIVAPLGKGMVGKRLNLDWERFCSVQIGATMPEPHLNLIRHNHFDGMMKTLTELENLGYERIGFAVCSTSDLRSYHRWTSAYLHWRTVRGFDASTLPSFYYQPDAFDPLEFGRWFRQHKIEAFIGMDEEPLEACQRLGLKIPEDLGFSVLDRPSEDSSLSGIDQLPRLIGSRAVDDLVLQIRKGAKGVPSHSTQTMVEGRWVQAETVTRIRQVEPNRMSPYLDIVKDSF